jgi:hypothetical protein
VTRRAGGQSSAMSTYAEGTTTVDRGRFQAARIVTTIAGIIVTIIVAGILLVVFDANQSNGLVNAITDVASWFADPFKGIFTLDNKETQVAVNWGIGALVYAFVGGLIARIIAR